MRIAIDSGPLKGGHSIRGVGAYTRELTKELVKLQRKDLKIESIDFEKVNLEKYDLVHFPFFHPFFVTLPTGLTSKVVVTIHDLIPLIYPKQYPPGLKGKIKIKTQKHRLKAVDGMITPSETSKKDIVRLMGVNQNKIKVIYEAPKSIFKQQEFSPKILDQARKKYKLPKKFIKPQNQGAFKYPSMFPPKKPFLERKCRNRKEAEYKKE